MIKKEFLPPSNTPFARSMIGIEQYAGSGGNVVLTIITNDYLIPWWLTNSYISDQPTDLWNVLFAIGFVPAYVDPKSVKLKRISKPRIALIARPTSDLRNAADIRMRFREIGTPVDNDNIDVLNGSDNVSRTALGRFGLLKEEIEKSLSKNQILFYYGHFELDEEFPERSYLEALSEYAAGRKESEVPPDKISLDSIKHLLKGKILFLDACRSIGLPYLGDDPFPPERKVLPHFYMRNKVICVGTIYPIFDDAAVDYMTLKFCPKLRG